MRTLLAVLAAVAFALFVFSPLVQPAHSPPVPVLAVLVAVATVPLLECNVSCPETSPMPAGLIAGASLALDYRPCDSATPSPLRL